MSDPIDIIDLTIDSPLNRTLRLCSINVENISNNSRRKPKRRNRSKQGLLQVSVIEIPAENTCDSEKSMEIIDLDNINSSEYIEKVHCDDNPVEENINALSCPICYEQLTSEMKPMSTRCGHIFCAQCLKLSMRNAKQCPKCKKTVKLQSCTRLYF